MTGLSASHFSALARKRWVYFAAGVVGALLLTGAWPAIYASKAYDHFDLGNFFAYAAWVDGHGALYVQVKSDYLLLANLLFAPFRLMATHWNPFHDPLSSFGWIWVTTSWFLFVWTAWIVQRRGRPRTLRLWLAPAPLYFTLFRYDVYLVLLTFAFLFSLDDRKLGQSALWLGLIIALKGYALWLLPCYFTYLWSQRGPRRALTVTALAVVPFAVEHLAVYLYAGVDGVLMPYRMQGSRPCSGESSYAAIAYLFGAPAELFPSWVARTLQAAVALAAASMRPRTFQEWLRASAFAVLGFVFFSTFSAPQYFLWFLPMIILSEDAILPRAASWLSWLSFIEYPLVQFLFGSRTLKAEIVEFLPRRVSVSDLILKYAFPPVVIGLNIVRALIMVTLAWPLLRRRRTAGPGMEASESAARPALD
jgi:hypothetical protein